MGPLASNPVSSTAESLTVPRLRPVDVVELSPTNGQLIVPAMKEVSVALALTNSSAKWQDSSGLPVKEVTAGAVSICRLNETRHFEMEDSAKFAVIQLQDEVFEPVRQEIRHRQVDLQAHDILHDSTLRRFLKILLREKRSAFQSGVLFLDSIAIAMASYLVRHYSVASSTDKGFTGGMTPSVLRRCIEFMETHLERDLQLSELAREAGISTSHFIRSFRQSTGKTPHQYLIRRRIERAKTVMNDERVSLTEVALASGFADQHHLSRIFRRITGMTPSTYRRAL